MSLVKSVIVLGNDEHAWLSAAMLAFNCPWLTITLIANGESEKGFNAAYTRGECQHFFEAIGLPWQELLFSASATYKLANRYVNCRGDGLDFFHGHGVYGADIGLLEFHQIFSTLRSRGLPTKFDAFSLESQAARDGKFIVNRGSAWGLHYDRLSLIRLLKTHAQKLGVKYISDDVAEINSESVDEIKKIITESGHVYSADFYIDARAEELALLEGNRIVDSWFMHGPSEWCLTAYLREQHIYLPVTEYIQISDQCWIKRVPLQSQTAVEIHGSSSVPKEQDFAEVFNSLGLSINEDSIRLIFSGLGRKKVFWSGNCLSLGNASVSLGNLAFPLLEITKFQMEKFIKYFPDVEQNSYLLSEYNRLTTGSVDGVLDYHNFILSVLLKNNTRSGDFRGLSPSLASRISLFMATGRYELRENELISKDEWISLFMGLDIPIEQQDPLLNMNELEYLGKVLHSKSAEIVKTVDEMPNHLIFLSQFLQTKNKR